MDVGAGGDAGNFFVYTGDGCGDLGGHGEGRGGAVDAVLECGRGGRGALDQVGVGRGLGGSLAGEGENGCHGFLQCDRWRDGVSVCFGWALRPVPVW